MTPTRVNYDAMHRWPESVQHRLADHKPTSSSNWRFTSDLRVLRLLLAVLYMIFLKWFSNKEKRSKETTHPHPPANSKTSKMSAEIILIDRSFVLCMSTLFISVLCEKPTLARTPRCFGYVNFGMRVTLCHRSGVIRTAANRRVLIFNLPSGPPGAHLGPRGPANLANFINGHGELSRHRHLAPLTLFQRE